MTRTEISLYLLLGHLLIAVAGSPCVPVECLKCNVTEKSLPDSCQPCLGKTQCINVKDIPSDCRKDFKVLINTTKSSVQEGDDITLTCAHNLPDLPLVFVWKKDGTDLKGQNKSVLVLRKVLSPAKGKYVCRVNSPCGSYKSLPHDVTVNSNTVVILVICGVSALLLVLGMGLAMKYKLQRDSTKHKERMKQRAQVEQSGGPTPFTPRES